MSKVFLTTCSLILSLVVTPVAAQNNAVNAGNDEKSYRVRLNGVFARICEGRAVQLTSPSREDYSESRQWGLEQVELMITSHFYILDDLRNISTPALPGYVDPKNGRDGELPLDLVATETRASKVMLTTARSPFDIHMKDVRVTAANVRSDGTWTMSLGWSSCTKTEKKK